MTEIEVTVEDARRCNRLRGLSVKDCACRVGEDGWQHCPPGAHLGVLDASVVRDVNLWLDSFPGLTKVRAEVSPMMTGEMCREPGCGGFLVRTGTCMTCQSCGNNEGCG